LFDEHYVCERDARADGRAGGELLALRAPGEWLGVLECHDFRSGTEHDRVPRRHGHPTATGPKVIVWNFTADRPGTWTYRCRYHPTKMTGTINVIGESRPLPTPGVGLVTGIMILTIGFVLVFAITYHVRAMRASKRKK
jgi:hypothetical protein